MLVSAQLCCSAYLWLNKPAFFMWADKVKEPTQKQQKWKFCYSVSLGRLLPKCLCVCVRAWGIYPFLHMHVSTGLSVNKQVC